MSRRFGGPSDDKSPFNPLTSPASAASLLLEKDGSYVGGPSSHSPGRVVSRTPSVASFSAQYSLAPSPVTWGAPLLMDTPEPDDELHNPNPQRDGARDRGSMFTLRGLTNVGCLLILSLGMLALFGGYPLVTHFTEIKQSTQGGFNLGGINSSGQIPDFVGNFGIIDKDTPISALKKVTYHNQEEFVLVFSDEFEEPGRTFYAGDDPYWEAVDLHYWGTNDLEWYDPQQVTTKDGFLQIRLDQVLDRSSNHNMSFRGGMLQSWNKFCFTGGLIEVSARLPGTSTTSGFWPGIWTMGNLGRAGYGATNDGTWPFSYDSCDVGTLPNQTYPGTMTPTAASSGGFEEKYQNRLSYQPGQRLSACTCPGESHPGPVRSDGSYVGRSAPEIDVLEAQVEDGAGQISMSAQFAPFNAKYSVPIDATTMTFDDRNKTRRNPYLGGVYQQCTSGLGVANQSCYEASGGCFTTYGFEYKPGFDGGYITWMNNNERAWTLYSSALVSDSDTEVDKRLISVEPMYIVINLAIAEGFGDIDLENLLFPATLSVDYVRVYQPKNAVNTGCDPIEYPTATYIETYKEAYSNYNLTTWEQFGQEFPKNKLMPGGCN